jgi:chromosome segregation ATPase
MAEDPSRGQSRTRNADTSGESGWITTDVAARAVRVSPRTIRRYIERGELEAKPQGEGVRREWLVSVDSLHALRGTRPSSAEVSELDRETERADSIADVLRDMSASLVARAEEAAELRVRLQLTEQAQSTIEEGRRRAEEELADERRRREAAEREREDLRRELEALSEARESPESPGPSDTTPAPEEAQEAAEPPQDRTHRLQQELLETRQLLEDERSRPWWRRVFGG